MNIHFENQSYVTEKQERLLLRNLKNITKGNYYPEVLFTHLIKNQWSYQFIDKSRGFDRTTQFGSITIGNPKTKTLN